MTTIIHNETERDAKLQEMREFCKTIQDGTTQAIPEIHQWVANQISCLSVMEFEKVSKHG